MWATPQDVQRRQQDFMAQASAEHQARLAHASRMDGQPARRPRPAWRPWRRADPVRCPAVLAID